MLLELSPHRISVDLLAVSVETFLSELYGRRLSLDIVLLDLNLSGLESIAYLPRIKRLTAPAKVIMVTGHDSPELLAKAVEAGADGYFVKRADPKPDLPSVVQLTHNGGAFLEPSISARLLQAFQNRKAPLRQINIGQISTALNIVFTKREVEVLDGLLEEMSYQEVADQNHISINTVRHYVKVLYQKVGVSSRKELIEKLLSI